MADSTITKQAFAAALKELIEDQPFSKISVGNICDKCNMSRKSFYYHFKDKYDLVNWIYDTEFFNAASRKDYAIGWDLLDDLCGYFYKNRNFYYKTFNVDGQNSFSDHFRNIVHIIITNIMVTYYHDEAVPIEFYVEFFTDAFYCAIKKWIISSDCVSAEIFVQRLKQCLLGTSTKIVQRFSK